MMKTVLLFLLSLSFNSLIMAQSLDWALSFGGLEKESAYGIKPDNLGNVYLAGYFGGTVDFDPGAGVFNLTALGDENIYVQKLDSTGNFIWAKAMLGSLKSRVYVLDVDATGNVYLTGYFQGTVDFDPNAGTENITSSGEQDLFVEKIDSNGNLVWIKTMGGTGIDIALGIAVDAAGNVYTSGGFSGSVDFDPGSGTSMLTSNGDVDIFVQKLDANGNFVWAKGVGGGSGDYSLSVDIDASGNSYNTGYFRDTVDFDPNAGTSIFISNGSGDIFIQKLDANGDFVWAKTVGSTKYDRGFALEVDGQGNIYSTGHFQDTVDFDPGTGQTNITSVGENDIYVQKLDPSGNLLWAKGVGSLKSDYGITLTVDKNSNAYTTGYYTDKADFNPGSDSAIFTPNAGSADVYIQQLDANGDFVWATSLGGNGFDRANSIAVDDDLNIYITGHFDSIANFNPGPDTTLLTPLGNSDVFIVKLNPEYVSGIKTHQRVNIKLYPNPTTGIFTIELPKNASFAQLEISDVSGRMLYQRKLINSKNRVNVSYLPSGAYLVNLILLNGEKYFTRMVLNH